MDIDVRYIPTDITVKNGANGNKPALCFAYPDRKKVYCVINDELSIRLETITPDVYKACRVVPTSSGSEAPYPPDKFAKHIDRIAANKTITPGAVRMLDVYRGNPLGDDEDPEAVSEAPTAKPGAKVESGKKELTAPSLVAKFAAQLNLEPSKLRKYLRAKGLHAPYNDEAALQKMCAAFGKDDPKPAPKAKPEPSNVIGKMLGKMKARPADEPKPKLAKKKISVRLVQEA